ncbi:MAG: DNA mismatch repair endonuclease MutL, partial [Desulfuromonadales bacterium]|nr:DNA mismatch repair endonuclease MutL [Desulfuromonadales bacterium]
MSNRIQILPENLANQIAAGEVVERPASVVKELVENSIDALASEIFVDIEQGGKTLVRVTDNGQGMKKDDAFLSLERHATSKVKCAEDLFALHTMGFRGEALPAIASVSRLRLTTRSADDEAGWQIYAEAGTIRQADAAGVAPGTVVEVRNLFFNTPGRRKFLRKEETEFGHIADVVSRLALSRPDIHFRLSHNGRSYLEAYRHNRLEERAAALLGRNVAGGLLPVEADSGNGEMLVGLLGSPGISRSTTGQVYTYVNGRFVRDRVVQHAIIEAYRSLLEKRRYPIAVLFIDMPPEMVDVNVHPTKHEVRFRNQQQVHDFIVAALRERLQQVACEPATAS